jgi:hypothetical protein
MIKEQEIGLPFSFNQHPARDSHSSPVTIPDLLVLNLNRLSFPLARISMYIDLHVFCSCELLQIDAICITPAFADYLFPDNFLE